MVQTTTHTRRPAKNAHKHGYAARLEIFRKEESDSPCTRTPVIILTHTTHSHTLFLFGIYTLYFINITPFYPPFLSSSRFNHLRVSSTSVFICIGLSGYIVLVYLIIIIKFTFQSKCCFFSSLSLARLT